MVLADGQGIPMGVSLHPANPAEVTLAEETLGTVHTSNGRRGHPHQNPKRLITDLAYESDSFRQRLLRRGIELIAPHRSNRIKPKHQDEPRLRRYRKRWKIERSIGWLANFRRLVVRWDHDIKIFEAFVHIAYLIIVCRYL